MASQSWEAYLLADTGIFATLSIYSLIRIILVAIYGKFSYKTRFVFRLLAFSLSVTLSFLFLVVYYYKTEIGSDVVQVCIICLSNATCLSFFYSIFEWDSICRQISFTPCQSNVVLILSISIVAVTGLCQLCSYFIKTKASPYVFFFLNSLALFVQMEFVLGYGTLYCNMTLRDLNDNSDVREFNCYLRLINIAFIGMVLFAVFGFGCFVASFIVNLDSEFYYNLFSGLCGRFPRITMILSSLLIQDLMDSSANKAVALQRANTESLV